MIAVDARLFVVPPTDGGVILTLRGSNNVMTTHEMTPNQARTLAEALRQAAGSVDRWDQEGDKQ